MTLKGILIAIGLGMIIFSGYMLKCRPENAQFNLGYLYAFVSTFTLLGLVIGSILITISATHLRVLGIVGCTMMLLCVVSMTVAEKMWGGSMGSNGWIIGFVSIVFIIPAALLLCFLTGIVSLTKIIELHAAARVPVITCVILMPIGFIMFIHLMNKPPNIERMIQALRNTDTTDRLEAIHAVSEIQDARIVEPMIHILQNSNEECYIRSAAAWALGKQAGDSRIIQPLIEALHEKDIGIKEGVIFSLGQIARVTGMEHDSRAVDALVHTLENAEEPIRRASVQSLGWVEDDRVIPLLIHALRDESSLVRFHVHEHLIRITGLDFGENLEQWQAWYEKTSPNNSQNRRRQE